MPFRTLQELENARENNRHSEITTSAVTAVKGAAGFVERIWVNASPTSAFEVHDDASTTGSLILTVPASVAAATNIELGFRFDNGLTISSQSSDTDITVVYR